MQQIVFFATPADPGDYLPFSAPPEHPERNVERVNRGIALMDQKYPHWWRVLDIQTLDLRSTSNCVLGQVAGDFLDGMNTLFGRPGYVPWHVGVDHGFDATSWQNTKHVQSLWKNEVARRQAKLAEVNEREETYV
jgi:hypothetical protein